MLSESAKKPIDERTLVSLGWTFAESKRAWVFHGVEFKDLKIGHINIGEVLGMMHGQLSRSMRTIETAMRDMGAVDIGTEPMPAATPAPAHAPVTCKPPRETVFFFPGDHMFKTKSKESTHAYLDAAMKEADLTGGNVHISVEIGPKCPTCFEVHP